MANGAQSVAGNALCTFILIHTPGASPAIYSGIMEYEFDNGGALLAGTTRYQRTSPTHLDISARNTVYPSRSFPQLDANNEIDPNDPNFIQRFSRFGASFDPTSAMTPGSYLYASDQRLRHQRPRISEGPDEDHAILLPARFGSAFLGSGVAAINQPTVWQVSGTPAPGTAVGTIDGILCAPQTGVALLNAQFQPLQYSAASGQYSQHDDCLADSLCAYQRVHLYRCSVENGRRPAASGTTGRCGFAARASQPATPAPIPQNVVADPTTQIIRSTFSVTAPRSRKP